MHSLFNINEFKLEKWYAPGKVGCIFPNVVISIPPHMEFGSDDHRKDATHFITNLLIFPIRKKSSIISFEFSDMKNEKIIIRLK